jgi:hypothetical protein
MYQFHRFAYFLSVSYFLEYEANICSHASRYGFNYYLNILWFLFKCAILHIIAQIFASCAATPSLCSSASLRLRFQI